MVFAAAGCGGGDDSTSSVDKWASSFCTSFTDYVDSLKGIATTVTGGNLSRNSLQSAANDAVDATKTFTSDVKGLGAPQTPTGEEAKQQVDTLADQLSADADKIKTATQDISGASGIATAVSLISTTVASAKTQIQNTVDQLKTLAPAGEMRQAFASADSCSALSGS
jgi:hypothetical protein